MEQSASKVGKVGELQVSQDLGFQRRMWRVQRAGWAVFAIAILAAFTGFLGDGPLASTEARAGDDLTVSYDRIERHRSPSMLEITVATAAADGGTIELWLDRQYVDALGIERILPQPESVETDDRRISYTFEVDTSRPRAVISFDVLYQALGMQSGGVGISDGASVSYRQFILP